MTSDATTGPAPVTAAALLKKQIRRPREAAELSQYRRRYHRDRGTALGRLATAYLAVGDPEQDAHAGIQALRIAATAGSIRTLNHVRAVAREFGDHHQSEPVAQLVDELATI